VVYLEQGRVLADLPVDEFFDAKRLRAVSPKAQLFVQGELP
jgi:tungstate transport system ATP-binding protein